jgi:ribosomal protein L20
MRVKSISARRHRKILDQAKGFRQARSRRIRFQKSWFTPEHTPLLDVNKRKEF